jgi:spore protease
MALYTDLALEARSLDPDIPGVKEDSETRNGVNISRIKVETQEAAKRLKKGMGSYVTLDLSGSLENEPRLVLPRLIAEELRAFIEYNCEPGSVLVAGLGNRAVTPDALGPGTAERIFVTRHIKDMLPGVLKGHAVSVSAFAPGVLGTTGIETAELIKGLVGRIKPDLVIAVDSLAAHDPKRLGSSVQISDAGIEPGAGVGNLRAGIDKDSLGIPVIAIGVPLVVYSSAIVYDVLSSMARAAGEAGGEEQLFSLAGKVMKDGVDSMIVTPKDIDRIAEEMACVLAEGINRALFGRSYEELKALFS